MALFKGKMAFKSIELVPGGISIGFGDIPPAGRTYYVNNITGASGNGGLSWNKAFDEVSTAITASEAYIDTLATNNQYVRNRIAIQGTATAYTQLTALPQYCDMVGIGADPRGNGTGIARIGPDTIGSASYDGVNADAVRGTNFYNLQFQTGSAKAAFDCDKIFRTVFDNCAFMSNNDAASPTFLFVSGISGTTNMGASGMVMKNCHFGGASGAGDATVGLKIDGTHFHNCLVENCFITGVTGLLVDASVISGWNSMVKGCIFCTGFTTQTASINDDATTGYIRYVGNYYQVKPTLASNANSRCFGNMLVNGAIATLFEAFTDS